MALLATDPHTKFQRLATNSARGDRPRIRTHFDFNIIMRLFGLCSAHCKMRNIATINENFGIWVAYMTWAEQRVIETVGRIGMSVQNVYL